MNAPPVDLRWTAETPRLPAEPAIVLAASAASEHGSFRRIVVHGAFQIDERDGERLGVMPLHAAVVLVVTSGLVNQATPLLGETFGFADDEQQVGGGMTRGAFHVDLLERFRPPPFGVVHVTAAIGGLLSNTVTIAP